MSEQRSGAGDDQPRISSRNKRAEILAVATDQFGEVGYEDAKWADVAAAVGIGSTALYHYFESKLHCLFVIMAEATEAVRDQFSELTVETDFGTGVERVLRSGFDLSDREVQRNRVLVAQGGRVRGRRKAPREEEARQMARARQHDLEVAWATHLARGMEQGKIPEADPQLLARAVLGMFSSVWQWYRPGGILSLGEVADFFVPRHLAMIGLEPLPGVDKAAS